MTWDNISQMAWNAYVGDRGESSDARHVKKGTLPESVIAEWRRRMKARELMRKALERGTAANDASQS